MKIFTLSTTYKILEDGVTEVCLKPSDLQISYYLATYKVYNTEGEAIDDLNNFITEQTPIMYHIFKYSDNIPLDIRNEYELV
jgi:hypothetical protein